MDVTYKHPKTAEKRPKSVIIKSNIKYSFRKCFSYAVLRPVHCKISTQFMDNDNDNFINEHNKRV